MIGLNHFLVVGAVLFCLGIFAVLTRRNAISILMGVELILNSANLNFVAFSNYSVANINGQMFAMFVIILAAAEAAVALAIILSMYRDLNTLDPKDADSLKG